MDKANSREYPIVVAVDIGTTKVCAIAACKNPYGKLEILAISKVESEGVLRGVVSNIEKTEKAIAAVVRSIEQRLNKKVHSIHIGIAGQHIKSVQHQNSRIRENAEAEISKQDIQKLVNDMHRLVLPPGDKILHVIPQEYTIDSEVGITDPIGMSGVKLETKFHLITGQTYAINNLKKCVERAGVKLVDITLEPIASAAAILSAEEKEAGIALIDIGGGTTDLTIYFNGILRHASVIPLGGNAITKDIKEGCSVMQNQAEKLKVKYGQAIASEVHNDKIITIPGLKGRDNKEISLRNLALIIQARLEEIFDFVMWEIKKSGYENKLIGGIVLTGGGALLKNIELLAAYHMGYEARVGLPVEHLAHGYHENIASPIYSTSIGLACLAVQNAKEGDVEHRAPEHNENKNISFTITNSEEFEMAEASNTLKRNTEHTKNERTTNESEPKKQSWGKNFLERARTWFDEAEDSDLT